MSSLTKAELYAAGAACCLAACEYGQPLDDAEGRATVRRLRATALQLLTIPGGIEPTQIKDLGMRLLEEAGSTDDQRENTPVPGA